MSSLGLFHLLVPMSPPSLYIDPLFQYFHLMFGTTDSQGLEILAFDVSFKLSRYLYSKTV